MTTHPSACQGCSACCAVLVEESDGVITAVKGNPASPATGGAVCPALQITLQQRVDPDRVTTPLLRTNPVKKRGEDPGFKPVSWDYALDLIAERMLALRREGKGERLVVSRGRCTGISNLLFKALPDIFGTPNRITHDGICAEAEKLACGSMDGIWDYRDFDFANAECIVLWGADPLVSNRCKPIANKLLPKLADSVRVFVVDPHFSYTATRLGTDCWVPIIPGTDGALALAMAHVILIEGLWSKDYVGDFADGRNRFKTGGEVDPACFEERGTLGLIDWWNSELRYRTPQWAAPLCGVSASRIVEMARALATAGSRSISWVSPGVTMTARGLASGMACHALNALTGSIDSAGGVRRLPLLGCAPWPSTEPYQDTEARRANACEPVDQRRYRGLMAAKDGSIHANTLTNRLADAILCGEPYPVEMMIGYWNNFAFSCSDTQRWEEALAKLPFFVHVTTNVSETSRFADIVLPAKNHLYETWGYAVSRMQGHSCVHLQTPVIAAPGEARADESEFPFMLAQKLAAKRFCALLDYYRDCFPEVLTGKAPSNGIELGRNAVQQITRPLWEAGGSWERFLSCGVAEGVGAKAPLRAAGELAALPTPSGRFEFCSSVIARMLAEYTTLHDISQEQAVAELGYECSARLLAMPHWEAPLRVGDAVDYPLVFSQHRAFASLEGRSANTELFQRMKGMDPGDEAWGDVLKVHPDDLARLGIEDGAMTRLVSPIGSAQVKVRAWKGVLPGVVSKCYGQGHWAYGRIAALDFERSIPRGVNANELVPAVYEGVSGATARHGGVMRVRLERIDDTLS